MKLERTTYNYSDDERDDDDDCVVLLNCEFDIWNTREYCE